MLGLLPRMTHRSHLTVATGTSKSILVEYDDCFLKRQTLASPEISMNLVYRSFSGKIRYGYRKTGGILELMISSLPRATIDHEREYACYSMRDRGVKKPLKTTYQLVSKIYSDTARCLKEDSAESKEDLTDFEVVD